MYTIYEDDYKQTNMPDVDSDGCIELFWGHPDHKQRWSARWAPYPCEKWSQPNIFGEKDSLNQWSPYDILLLHFGIYELKPFLNSDRITALSPEIFKWFKRFVTSTVLEVNNLPSDPSLIEMSPDSIAQLTMSLTGENYVQKTFKDGSRLLQEMINIMSLAHPSVETSSYFSCFISYSSKDKMFAEKLHADLKSTGVNCWFAPNDMKVGDKIWNAIDIAITNEDKLLLILSSNSICSEWVEDEVIKAFSVERQRKDTILVPLRIDGTIFDTNKPWATKLRDSRHIGDFQKWDDIKQYQNSLQRLIRDLKVSN